MIKLNLDDAHEYVKPPIEIPTHVYFGPDEGVIVPEYIVIPVTTIDGVSIGDKFVGNYRTYEVKAFYKYYDEAVRVSIHWIEGKYHSIATLDWMKNILNGYTHVPA